MGKKINNLYLFFGLSVLTILFATGMIFSTSPAPITIDSSDTAIREELKKIGTICYSTTGDFGGRISEPHVGIMEDLPDCISNLAVDMGLNATRDILGQGTIFGAFDFIAINNATEDGSAPAAGDIALAGEWIDYNLSRSQGTYTTVDSTPGTWTVSYTFTANQSSGLIINKSCLFNQSSGGTMLACNTFTDITMNGLNSDQTTLTWTNNVTNG